MKPLPVSIAFFLVVLLVAACNKKSASSDTVASVITQGSWKVHFYSKDGTDGTSTYSTYNFTFKADGSLTASNGAVTTSGAWSEINDSGKIKFVLVFVGGGIPVSLLELQEDWIVDTKSATMIELSKSGGSAKVLHFQKS